ncbi:MAG: sporulation protein YabP [Clostridiales bacterium]|nr:sporulation protein YabP [Clostridiales bacterium]
MNDQGRNECGLRLRTHCVHMDDRELLSITGVKDLGCFNENEVALSTEGGDMVVEGVGLHITKLDLEDGQVMIEGGISAVVYEDDKPEKKTSLLARMFR